MQYTLKSREHAEKLVSDLWGREENRRDDGEQGTTNYKNIVGAIEAIAPYCHPAPDSVFPATITVSGGELDQINISVENIEDIERRAELRSQG